MESSYRFVIADDHPLFRGALREAVSGLFADATIAEAGSFDDASALLDRDSDVDLVLLDLAMPGVRGFSGLMYLRAQYPSVPVIVVSANDDPAVIRRCMEFGASGFIPKTLGVEAMRTAIARVLEGGVWTPPDVDLKAGTDAETADLMARLSTLTPQQVRVLMMLSEGLLNKQIAYNLTRLGSDREGARLRDPAKAQRREPDAGGDRGGQDRNRPVAAERLVGTDYSAAAMRCTRHCAISARSAAGLSGLLSTWMSRARASSRTSGERSAVIRIAGRSSPKRQRSAAIASMPLPLSR